MGGRGMKKNKDVYEMREYAKNGLHVKYYASTGLYGDYYIEREITAKKKESLYLEAKDIEFLLDVIKETRL
jgi:hypothetical protein